MVHHRFADGMSAVPPFAMGVPRPRLRTRQKTASAIRAAATTTPITMPAIAPGDSALEVPLGDEPEVDSEEDALEVRTMGS